MRSGIDVGHRIAACVEFRNHDSLDSARRQDYISGCVRPFQIARERHADNRRDSTPIERIALDDDDRPSKARA